MIIRKGFIRNYDEEWLSLSSFYKFFVHGSGENFSIYGCKKSFESDWIPIAQGFKSYEEAFDQLEEVFFEKENI